MTGLLTNLSDQDLADIAAYFASQKGSVGAADPKMVARGEDLFRGGNLEKACPPAPAATRRTAQATPPPASRTWAANMLNTSPSS
jgi:hypothetical protein